MKNHLVVRMLLFYLDQVLQTADICHAVSAFGRKRMTDDFIIPKVHIKCQLVVNTLHIKGRHVTDNALQRSVDLYLRQEQIRKDSEWISGFLILVVLGFALNSRYFAALVRIRI